MSNNSSNDDQKFHAFTLPDISKVDPNKITKFSQSAPAWRKVASGLNMQGKCKNKQCQAYNKRVWTKLGFGQFHMSQCQCSLKCPICQKQIKGIKKIGIYKCQLTGKGRKYFKQSDDTDDQEQAQRETQQTQNNENSTNFNADQFRQKIKQQDKQIQFPKIICNKQNGFLKMDGVNGPFVQWRYMILNIKKCQSIQK